MLSLQNPHHLPSSAAMGPMAFGPASRSQEPNAFVQRQGVFGETFKTKTKVEDRGGVDVVELEDGAGSRSVSHSSCSSSGSGERRKQRTLKRRRAEAETVDKNPEVTDQPIGRPRRFESLDEEDDGEMADEDDDDDEKEIDGVSEEEETETVQRKILTQKPLGLLAQHGLSSRSFGSSSVGRFHAVQRSDDLGDEESPRQNGGIRDRDGGVIDRDGGFRDRDGRVIDRDGEVSDRDGGFRDRDDVIKDCDGGITDRDGGIIDRDGGIADRDVGIIDRDETEDDDDGEDAENGSVGDFKGDLEPGGVRDEMAFYRDGIRDQRQCLPQYPSQHHRVIDFGQRGGDTGSFAPFVSLTDQRFMPSPPLSASPAESARCPSTPGQHHWTFEEQFKQLYELSDDPNRKLFLDDLFSFMQKRGTPVNRIPIMAKQTLDLFELFQLVVSKGGLVEVINKKLWREITKGLNLPSSITSAAFTLRTQYMKYLYPYECEKLKLSTLSELQYAVDGNRREGRRSGFGQEYAPLPAILPINPVHLHDGLNPGLNPATGRPAVSLSLKDRDQMMLNPAVNQLRTLAECDAEAVKAATRAMAEVTKRMEEATRAAAAAAVAAAASSNHPLHIPGPGPVPCPPTNSQVTCNSGLKTEEPPAKRSTAEDPVRYAAAPPVLPRTPMSGVGTAHIKLTNRENGHSNQLGNSIIGTMEINGILYQGVLFAQPPSNHQ